MHQILLRVLLASCLLAGIAFGQQDAVIAGATVIVNRADSGTALRTQTNDSSNYYAPNLAIGQYEVAVEMEGFKRAVRGRLPLQVNQRVQEPPLNGRQVLALTLLTASVIAYNRKAAAGFGDRGIELSSISINGSPNSMNAQMLDGNSNALSYAGTCGNIQVPEEVQ